MRTNYIPNVGPVAGMFVFFMLGLWFLVLGPLWVRGIVGDYVMIFAGHDYTLHYLLAVIFVIFTNIASPVVLLVLQILAWLL